MNKSERPSYSDNKLLIGETLAYYFGETRLGGMLIEKTVGANPEFYIQLQWLPRFKIRQSKISNYVTVPGIPGTKGPARKWGKAALLTVPTSALEEFDFGNEDLVQAVAYNSSKVWHVGILATGGAVFAEISNDQYGHDKTGVCVRRARGATDFTIGAFDLNDQQFTGVDSEIEAFNLDVQDIPMKCPGLALV